MNDTFCNTYGATGSSLVEMVPLFIWLALGLAFVFAAVEVIARLTKPAAVQPQPKAAIGPGDFVKTIIDLVTGLASAPIWLSVFALGIALYWFVGAGWTATCKPPAPSNVTSNASGNTQTPK